jgi:hypothetical protein
LIGDDQPCLANEFVNHPEEPILLLAHPDRHLLPQAVEAVSIEYEPPCQPSSRLKKASAALKLCGATTISSKPT